MTHDTKKAVVSTVSYAGFEFPGLKLPNGEYAISVTQAVELYARANKGFQFLKQNANRDIKAILGKGFQFLKSASEINPKKVNILNLEQFGELTFEVAFRGNEVAKAILKASVSTTLEQAFDVAFDNKKEIEDYVARVEVRVNNVLTRRVLTDAIANYILDNRQNLSDNYIKWIEKNCSDAVNKIVFGRSAKKLRDAWNCREIREMMTIEEQVIITNLERLASTLIIDEGFEPLSAVKEAGNRMLIKKIER